MNNLLKNYEKDGFVLVKSLLKNSLCKEAKSKKNSLKEAEGKCGGSIYNLLVGDKKKMENAGDGSKTSLFIQLANKINNPVADLLAGSSGSGKEGQAKKAMLQNLQTNSLKEGKHQLDCGLAKIIPSQQLKTNFWQKRMKNKRASAKQ